MKKPISEETMPNFEKIKELDSIFQRPLKTIVCCGKESTGKDEGKMLPNHTRKPATQGGVYLHGHFSTNT